ncbi:helix-turn-helix domain-containing protein [Actinobaculum sp. 352]|uniref:helix-turn-helix domain-containing protein n=1 Tax=Actinobaculum sp. 352 TaxID=2490946 RepID=UPI000F7E062C|nr:helix-turn-helix domain-containing protein [Actinobaculum sp. 352]RTE48142.1 DNA-binding protein [Actinobaculum sp. 352]
MVEYTGVIAITTALSDEDLLERLADYHVAVGPAPHGWSVTLSLPADSLQQAISTLLAVAGTVGEPRALTVRTSEEFDRVHGLEPLPELLSVSQAADALGLTRQGVLHRIHTGALVATKVGKTWFVPASAVSGTGEEPAA